MRTHVCIALQFATLHSSTNPPDSFTQFTPEFSWAWDWAKDGKTAGSPSMCTDFMTAGRDEGWAVSWTTQNGTSSSMKVSGMSTTNFASSQPAGTCSVSNGAARASVVTTSGDGALRVKHTLQLQEWSTALEWYVNITNLLPQPISDVYYMRHGDADIHRSTSNRAFVISQATGSVSRLDPACPHCSIVKMYSASTPQCGYVLGANHANSKVAHDRLGQLNTPQEVWASSTWEEYTEISPHSTDLETAIVFRFPQIAAGASESFVWVYAVANDEAVPNIRRIATPATSRAEVSMCESQAECKHEYGKHVVCLMD